LKAGVTFYLRKKRITHQEGDSLGVVVEKRIEEFCFLLTWMYRFGEHLWEGRRKRKNILKQERREFFPGGIMGGGK